MPKQEKPDPFKPSIKLLAKLGSIAVHADELTSPSGHAFDHTALIALISDQEVKDWIKEMGALVPKKR